MRRDFGIPAVATSMAGFGVMNVFWACQNARSGLRGLYSYLTSSLGDALCIPVVVGSVTAATASLPKATAGPITGVIVAVLSSGATLATQSAWLSDPNPDLNWTLPAPHVFNAAGWYHAAFSVCLAGYLGYQIGDLIARLQAHGINEDARKALIAGISAGTAFSVMLIIDNLPIIDRAASRASLMFLGGAVFAIGALLVWTIRQRPDR